MRIWIAVVPVMFLAGCNDPGPIEGRAVKLANPASEHCVKLRGTVEIRKEANGEVGYCHLPDGRVIEEWELFRSSVQKHSGMAASDHP